MNPSSAFSTLTINPASIFPDLSKHHSKTVDPSRADYIGLAKDQRVYSIPYAPAHPPPNTILPLSAPIPDSTPALFKPFSIRNVTFKNRIGVSPMCMYSSKDGLMTDFHLAALGAYALGGAGLVIAEMSAVQPNGRITPFCSGIWDDKHIAPQKRVVDLLHASNCVAGIQIAHAGRKASTLPPVMLARGEKGIATAELGGWPDDVVGPSPIPWGKHCVEHVKELSREDIKQLVIDFGKATVRAAKAGWDLIEIHGAHGYLLNSFLSPISNTRTDEYGGSRDNRNRIVLEVIREVRKYWPSDKVLSLRLSCDDWVEGGFNLDDTLYLVEQIVKLNRELGGVGVDIIDCSTGGNVEAQKIKAGPGFQVPYAAAVKAKFGSELRVSTVGLITQAKQSNGIIEDGKADIILMAREFLRNPYFARTAAKELGVNVAWIPQHFRANL